MATTTHFVDYSNATALMTAIGQKFRTLNGAYVIKGNLAFASIPSPLTSEMGGYVYNITDNFTTDSRFVEGAGKDYPANTNIVVVDLSTYAAAVPVSDPASEGLYEEVNGKYVLTTDDTVVAGKTYYEKTENIKLDVISSFVDVEDIYDKIKEAVELIAPVFDADHTGGYAEGDYVVKDGVIYQFTSAHTEGDPWDATEVDTIGDVTTFIDSVNEALNDRVDDVYGDLAPAFNPAKVGGYKAGDVVTYTDDKLYQFNTDHTGAWADADVDEITVAELVSSSDPASLTTEEVNTLIGLL